MKTAIALATGLALIFLATPASAKLTPDDGLPLARPDVNALYTGPAAAMLERRYFQTPPQPIASKPLQPCTVQMVVFDKARLAQACY